MTDTKKPKTLPSVLTYDDVRAVSPALEYYTKGPLLDSLWKRPDLSPRDRSVITVSALIARIQTIEMPFHFALALDNGVKASELSEIITHLAFYAGWANAMSAVAVAKDIFHQRGIGIDQLPPANDKLLSLNEEAETQRATQVSNNFGHVSPGLVQNTTDLLFRELWLRPGLAPRHRETSCTLIGNCSELNVNGTESAGRPARLNGTVARIMCVDGTFSPLTTYSSSPGSGAVNGITGHNSTSYF